MQLELDLQIASEDVALPAPEELRAWTEAALQGQQQPVELVIRIVDAAEGLALNKRYRGKAQPTNVLSFPFDPPPGIPSVLLGDVVICAPVVAREAQEQGKLLAAHWAHMVVHGTLHLLGYDHQNDSDAATMEQREAEILDAVGFCNPYEVP